MALNDHILKWIDFDTDPDFDTDGLLKPVPLGLTPAATAKGGAPHFPGCHPQCGLASGIHPCHPYSF
jgi:hypothetical protein